MLILWTFISLESKIEVESEDLPHACYLRNFSLLQYYAFSFLGKMDYVITTDLLNQVLFAEQCFRSELSLLLDRITGVRIRKDETTEKPRPTTPSSILYTIQVLSLEIWVSHWGTCFNYRLLSMFFFRYMASLHRGCNLQHAHQLRLQSDWLVVILPVHWQIAGHGKILGTRRCWFVFVQKSIRRPRYRFFKLRMAFERDSG